MTMAPDKWDTRFMLLAHEIAEWSKEHGRRVGAVIVGPDRAIRSTGFNGLPRGVNDDVPERHSRETGAKYLWSSHAYVPWFPCVECAKAIIQCGIREVVAYEPEKTDARWSGEFEIVIEMLNEAGVATRYIPRLKDLPVGPLG